MLNQSTLWSESELKPGFTKPTYALFSAKYQYHAKLSHDVDCVKQAIINSHITNLQQRV